MKMTRSCRNMTINSHSLSYWRVHCLKHVITISHSITVINHTAEVTSGYFKVPITQVQRSTVGTRSSLKFPIKIIEDRALFMGLGARKTRWSRGRRSVGGAVEIKQRTVIE